MEDRAHMPLGHFPTMFAELAHALHEVGCQVAVLTSEGWALEDREPPDYMQVRQLDPISRRIRLLLLGDGLLFGRLPWIPRKLAADVVMLVGARRARRRNGSDGVIVTCIGIHPFISSAFAGPGRWLIYRFGGPRGFSPVALDVAAAPTESDHSGGAITRLSRRAETQRRRYGGFSRIAVNSEPWRLEWTAAAPWLDPVRVPFTACRERLPIPDALAQLGLGRTERVALLFGASHPLKDYAVVYAAFEQMPDWQLIVAGTGAAEEYLAWRDAMRQTKTVPVLFKGFVSEETKALLHSAADVIVLSFKPGATADSGTLVDAVSWGLPCVCSDRCFSGQAVARLGLGPLFESGNAGSLVDAVRSAPRTLPSEVVVHARSEFSPRKMGEEHLAALELMVRVTEAK